MMNHYQATASARANIALAKYWGKRDAALNLPAVGSLSITLHDLQTRTEVIFDQVFEHDALYLNDARVASKKLTPFLDLIRSRAQIFYKAKVVSHNNFLTGAGLASSASAFAALALAASKALGLELSLEELSVLARQGSGSAARSIFGGFVEMHRGERSDGLDAFATPLLNANDWPLHIFVAVTANQAKSVVSTDGMLHTAHTSPLYQGFIDTWQQDVSHLREAVLQRDFLTVGNISEHSCLKMHATMLAANPSLIYWNGTTVEIMHAVRSLQKQGVPVFFTIDAGPQVKVICLPEAVVQVREALATLKGIYSLIETTLGQGVQLEHL